MAACTMLESAPSRSAQGDPRSVAAGRYRNEPPPKAEVDPRLPRNSPRASSSSQNGNGEFGVVPVFAKARSSLAAHRPSHIHRRRRAVAFVDARGENSIVVGRDARVAQGAVELADDAPGDTTARTSASTSRNE